MIGRLNGICSSQEPDGMIVVDVNGVGYEVLAPLGTLGAAKSQADEAGLRRHTLFIHTHVREDAFLLYGFASPEDRILFRALISVSSIGPKTAVHLLSVLPGGEMVSALAQKEVGRLTAVPGIGKKTAERLILELSGKLDGLFSTAEKGGASATPSSAKQTRVTKNSTLSGGSSRSGTSAMLVNALMNLGYKMQEAELACSRLEDEIASGKGLSELVKEAFKILSK